MRVIVQRVSEASVMVDQQTVGAISKGVLVLLGIEHGDDISDIEWICKKVVQLRIFSDNENKMNLSLIDVRGSALVVSQFTLHASTKKGNRPSFTRAAQPSAAKLLYETFCKTLGETLHTPCETGVFGADMKVALVNDGPVTIIIDSKLRE